MTQTVGNNPAVADPKPAASESVPQPSSMSRLLRPLRSLPMRIILSVFSAALVTSLVVAWFSTRSIESFLRTRIEQKFPAVLQAAEGRMDVWYGQRVLEVEAFARSDVLAKGASQVERGGEHSRRLHSEIRQYLTYVLDSSPELAALFITNAEGHAMLSVGRELRLDESFLEELAASSDGVGALREIGDVRGQLVSAAIEERGDDGSCRLHALLVEDVLEPLLAPGEDSEGLALYAVDPEGRTLLAAPGTMPPARFPPELLTTVGAVVTRIPGSGHDAARRVVSSARPFERLGWTLVVEQPYDQAFSPLVRITGKITAVNVAIVAVFGLLAYAIARSIVRPVMALSESARRIANGETDVPIHGTESADEIGVLARALEEMTDRVLTRNVELARANEELERLSITDELTGLYNHRHFQEQLLLEQKRADRSNAPLSLVVLDIDHFKALNDRHGHAGGDTILRAVGDAMRGVIRETDVLARYGGEEFAVLALGQSIEGATVLAEKLRGSVAALRVYVPTPRGAAEVRVTVSAGVALYTGDPKVFFVEADNALYRAKDAGRDCVIVAGDS